MSTDVVPITVKAIMPTDTGCAVFLGDEAKTFRIYVDPFIGGVIQMTLKGLKKERPLTHDLIGSILLGLETRLERVVINEVSKDTFFARILLQMENELGRKIIEIDARPSDSIVLALQQQRPIFAAREVYDTVDDVSDLLERVLKRQAEEGESEGESPAP